jgi:hypothetical protein
MAKLGANANAICATVGVALVATGWLWLRARRAALRQAWDEVNEQLDAAEAVVPVLAAAAAGPAVAVPAAHADLNAARGAA